jgi:hypothetical protein
VRSAILLAAALVSSTASAAAQSRPPATGRLSIVVADPSGAVIPSARVIVSAEGELVAHPIEPVVTTAAGVATIEALPQGRYVVQAGFPGFETVTVRNVRVRAGENRRTVTLPIKKVAEDVTVGRDARTSALDPRGQAFSTVLTREQIELLPDDPDEMEAALKAMAPPGAVIRIDGFTGGKLPPKSQIRSIRLPRMDLLAAQNHGGMSGMLHIDIMTQPGNGPLRGSVDAAFRDDALNARHPFAPEKGDEGMRQGGLSLSGTIVPNRSSFSIAVQQARLHDTGNLLAAMPDRTIASAIARPSDRQTMTARFDQAIGPAHALRVSYQRAASELRNLGVGGFDLPERAFSTTGAENILRLSENGPVGRRLFSESRVQIRWSDSRADSILDAPAIRVLDAFTAGGAQRRGGSRATELEAATDLDYVRGSHSFRTGLLVEAGRYRSDEVSNYLGTWTFASLADYQAGRPSNYSRRIGDPNVRYSNLQFGAYLQDDYRATRTLMLSYGVRYEAQAFVADRNNISPRLSVTWSPLESGRTTFRAGVGRFTDWIGTAIYEQTVRFDGTRQQEINVIDPSWPDPPADGARLPGNTYALASGADLPDVVMANAGVEQVLTPALRLNATYTYRRGSGLLRGRNLNAPVNGVRPNPAAGNVVEAIDGAQSRVHQAGMTASLMLLNWRQTFFAASYVWSLSETNTLGAFALPANGDDLSTEWGPSTPRHRASLMFNTRPIGSVAVNLTLRAQSGTPYDVTVGADVNGDGLFNDRPVGMSRNSAVGGAQFDAGLRVSYTLAFGPRRDGAAGGQVVMIGAGGGGGGMPAGLGGAPTDRRFRIELYAAAQNVTNHRNYIGYSGVLASPFFGSPTNVLNPRKIEIGARFGF